MALHSNPYTKVQSYLSSLIHRRASKILHGGSNASHPFSMEGTPSDQNAGVSEQDATLAQLSVLLEKYTADNSEEEIDSFRHQLDTYALGGLIIAPLSARPTAILDLGTGAGYFPRAAMLAYPDADVQAVDKLWSAPFLSTEHQKIDLWRLQNHRT